MHAVAGQVALSQAVNGKVNLASAVQASLLVWRVCRQRSTSVASDYWAPPVLRHLPLPQQEVVLQNVSTACNPFLQEAILQTDAVAAKRRMVIGPNTALSYDAPLHIVRGEGSHLFDAEGDDYLDCCNNVAHVGHCHPKVSSLHGPLLGLPGQTWTLQRFSQRQPRL